VEGTPSAVLLSKDGLISSPLAEGQEAIEHLVALILRTPASKIVGPQNGEKNGAYRGPTQIRRSSRLVEELLSTQANAPAPAFMLPDLDGRMATLKDFEGQPTLLLFWNPDCGYCAQMLGDLKSWFASPGEEAPQLLVISTGTVESNRALGLPNVVLDESFNVGRQFGARGTPSAILVDSGGKIASSVAAGAPEVMLLLRGKQVRDPALLPTGAQ
jgi:peroxiredoxin